MREHYEVSVYILTDSHGEWWETIGKDGTSRRFVGDDWNMAMEFKTADAAKKYVLRHDIGRHKILRLTPPVNGITWSKEVVAFG